MRKIIISFIMCFLSICATAQTASQPALYEGVVNSANRQQSIMSEITTSSARAGFSINPQSPQNFADFTVAKIPGSTSAPVVPIRTNAPKILMPSWTSTVVTTIKDSGISTVIAKKTSSGTSTVVVTKTVLVNPAVVITKTGAGNPVMFLPGFMSPGSIWQPTVNKLPARIQSFMVSYAGFNGLAPVDTPWYPKLLQELEYYIRENHLANLVVVGHSMGGNLAVDLAAALPDHVSKLILVDAIPCQRELMMPGVSASQIQYESPYNKQMLAMNDTAFNKMAKMMNGAMTSSPQGLDSLMKWAIAADRKTYVYGYTDLLKLDLRDKLKQVKVPTIILGASFPSADIVRQTFTKQYANLEQKSIEIAPNSKHFIMFDQPEWLSQQINNFIIR